MTTQASSTSSSRIGWRSALGYMAAVVMVVLVLNVVARLAEPPNYIGEMRAKLGGVPGSEAVVLGPSVAKHLVPAAMCLKGANIAESAMDVFEAEALARHLVARGEVPPVWIMGVIPSFQLADNGSKGSSTLGRRLLTYRTLQSLGDPRLIGDDVRSALRSLIFPALGHQEWRLRLRMMEQQMRGVGWARPDVTVSQKAIANEAEDQRMATEWVATYSAAASGIAAYDNTIADRSLASLLRLNRLLNDSGARLVIVVMPVSPATTAYFKSDESVAVTGMDMIEQRLTADGAVIINDLTDAQSERAHGEFRDAVHFNRSGGLRYSRDLGERLTEAGVIPNLECPSLKPDSDQ
ncbi:hypothetical protein [Qipengyuania marisflavi]|uniref:SGNH/GDSL hydrolase family protein n=1 Tax=Qipengyuania marisflavi TaxID=2486356 RepID=A0A5S3P8R3_9SPHN|nr:hypothetical protein [Qipengyuania marisflavi]TMM49703.1 hypothetical protein FEV51_00385 [Qipengyuania marisflavi]